MRKSLYVFTVALSASLLFVVEPAAAKALLPKFGGAAGVWIASILFFQLALLAGYLYAYALTRFAAPRAQALVHIAVLAFAACLLPWVPPGAAIVPGSPEHPSLAIVIALFGSIGLPFFALSSTSPLLQSWYGENAPQRLFALSNAASLLALLAYPVLIEPHLGLSVQFRLWSCLFVVFALACAGCVFTARAFSTEPTQLPGRTQAFTWAALAACAAALWPAVANHLSQEVAAIPLLWVLPLGIYLLTFVLCFEGRGWYRPQLFKWLVPLACLAIAWRLGMLGQAGGIEWEIPVLCAALFICCMFCHGELARLRPSDPGLAFFYFIVALGGAAGAAFVSLFAPNVFHTFLELPVCVAACFILSLWLHRHGRARDMIRISLVATAAFTFVNIYGVGIGSVLRVRNFYGALQVTDGRAGNDEIRSLYNGKILHGIQYLSPARSRITTAYYAPETGVGRVMRFVRGSFPWRVAVVGLGTGTLAAFGRPGDSYKFFDIDPDVIQIAWNVFRYLRESPAKVETIAIDGRLGLNREPPRSLNLIALDAFSGDSIPVHLLTREAFTMYFDRLADGGVIAIHITNRYLDVPAVVGAVAHSLGKPVIVIHNAADPARLVQATDWAILANRREDLAALLPFAGPQPGSAIAPWTDDYSNLFQIFR